MLSHTASEAIFITSDSLFEAGTILCGFPGYFRAMTGSIVIVGTVNAGHPS